MQLDIEYRFFAVEQTVTQDRVTHNVAPSAVKLSVALSGWNFTSPNNTLRLRSTLSFASLVESMSYETNKTNATITYPPSPQNNGTETRNVVPLTTVEVLCVPDPLSGLRMRTSVVLLTYGNVDNSSAAVPFGLTVALGNASSLDLSIDVPHFARSFRYDPDFSVSLDYAGEDRQDDSSSPDLLPLVALAALALPLGMLIVTVVGVSVACVYRRRAIRLTQTGIGAAVNVNVRDICKQAEEV